MLALVCNEYYNNNHKVSNGAYRKKVNVMIGFEEYCEDFLDLHVGLLSGKSLEEAKQSYANFCKPAPTIKEQKANAFNAQKDNEVAMLKFHNIDKAAFESATIETLESIRTSKEPVSYKDAQRQLWHDYREDLKKSIDKAFKGQRKITRTKAEQKSLDNAKKQRAASTALGGNALTGSAKQKSWGETLRKDFLSKATPEQAEFILAEKTAQSAKFWIESRDLSVSEILKLAGM